MPELFQTLTPEEFNRLVPVEDPAAPVDQAPAEAPVGQIPIEGPREVDVFHEPSGQTFRVPEGLTPKETEFAISPNDKPKIGVFDAVGNFASTIADGFGFFARGAASKPIPTLQLEYAETFLDKVNEPFGAGDVFSLIAGDPSSTKAAQIKFKRDILNLDVSEEIAKKSRLVARAREKIDIANINLARSVRGVDTDSVAFTLGNVVGSIGLAVGATVLTRSPSIAAILFGGLQRSNIYEEARASGKAPIEASALAKLAGFSEAALEFVGGHIFLDAFKRNARIQRFALRVAEEATQEALQQVAEETITQTSGVRPVDIKGALKNTAEAALYGMAGAAIVTAPITAIEATMKSNGVQPDLAKALAEKIEENKPELAEIAEEILNDLTSGLPLKQEDVEKAAVIFDSFVSGKEINSREVLGEQSDETVAALSVTIDQALKNKAFGRGVTRDIVEGRVAKIDEDIESLDAKISDATDALALAETENRGTKRLQKNLDKLTAEQEQLRQERGKITEPSLFFGQDEKAQRQGVADTVKGKPILLKEQRLKKLGVTANENIIRTAKKSFKTGIRVAKGGVKKAQEAAIKFLEGSGLTAKDKAKFLRAVKNIQSFEQLEKEFPKIQGRVISLLEKERNRQVRAALKKITTPTRAAIKKLVKGTKAPSKGRGRFDPETQNLLDIARNALKLGAGQAAERLEKNLADPLAAPSPEQAFENSILAVAAGGEFASASEIENVLLDLEAIKARGIAAAKSRNLKAQKEVKRTVTEAIAGVTLGVKAESVTTVGLAKRALAMAREGKEFVAQAVQNWDGIVDILFNKKGFDGSRLIKLFNVTPLTNLSRELAYTWSKKLFSVFGEAYGIKDTGSFARQRILLKMAQDARRVHLGEFINERGEKVQLEYSLAEARQFWLEIRQDGIEQSYRSTTGNAYTQEMFNAITDMLGPNDMAFALKLQAMYQKDILPKVQPVYSRMYGVTLGDIENYVPIARDRGLSPLEEDNLDPLRTDNFLIEFQYRRNITPSAIKRRKPNLLPLRKRGDVAVFHRHMTDMAHFVAFGEKMQLLNAVFSDARLQKEIRAKHGRVMMSEVNGFLEDKTRGYLRAGKTIERLFNLFNRNFAASQLALKAKIGLQQVTSIFAMGEQIPVSFFISGMTDFLKNPVENAKLLHKLSPFLRTRGFSPEVDIARLASQNPEFLSSHILKTAQDLFNILIRLGDRAPIYLGGWAVYRHAITPVSKGGLGKSQREAIEIFEKIAEDTQQSSALEQLSAAQRASALGRTLTLFSTAPMALLRREINAFRKLRRSKISARQFWKTFFIYHILIPQFFLAIVTGLRPEKEEIEAALIAGPFTGALVFGDIIFQFFIWAVSDHGKLLARSKKIPLLETVNDVARGIGDALSANSLEDLLQGIKDIASATGKGVGLPIEQGIEIPGKINELLNGDKEAGTKLLLGYPESIAKRK